MDNLEPGCAENNGISVDERSRASNSRVSGDVGVRVAENETGGEAQFEETSPDALKNTPSNIAKLEDVIENCKARTKYLAQTRSPSDGEDVRWYFCKVPLSENELAASIPRTEIVGKSEYFRFSMRDSLALEASFLQREEELLSAWWKEYAECSDGPSGPESNSAKTSSTTTEGQTNADDEERVGVPVKGGLYEVDLVKRHCFPVYWHGENRRVLRGHWFARKVGLEWLPLREDVAEQLEFAYRCQVWHRRTFQPSGQFAARVDLQGMVQGLHALFTGEDDTWEAWLGIDTSGLSSVIGFGGNGIKLRRGFAPSGSLKPTQDELRQRKEEEMDDYCSQVPVRHLVFMVHGIGQRLEKANLVDDVATYRHITASLAERHLTSYQRNKQRVLFIPCQWRRVLKLGGEAAVEKITLEGVRGLRIMLSATVHDVLYYMSPIYCQDIINSVSNQLNRLYSKFIKRNPGYDGKVSIYGHSLGSVLSYDILCHQESLSSPFPMEYISNASVENEGLPADASNQAAQFSNMLNLDETTGIGNDGRLSETIDSANREDNPSSLPESFVNLEGDSTLFSAHSESSLTLDVGSGLPGSCGSHPEIEENFHVSRQQTLDTEQQNVASLLEEDTLENVEGMGDMSDRSAKVLCTKLVDRPEDNGDKDKLMAMLKDEVESLKALVVKLQSRERNLLCTGEAKSSDCLQGDKLENVAPEVTPLDQKTPDLIDSRKSCTPYIKYTKLEFKVDTFFAVGSPLGVFLALRNIRIGMGEGEEYWQDEGITEQMPACSKMFNVFHPFDPVAYRVEPLVCKEYTSKRPVIIPYHKGGKRIHIGFQEFTEDLAARSQALTSRLNSMRVRMVNVFQPGNKGKKQAEIQDVVEPETRTYGSLMMERLTGSRDGRIDYMLQDATFEHPYISAIGSHTNYWRDFDTALFVLRHLYRDIPEEPETAEGVKDIETSKNQKRLAYKDSHSEDMEEDLPLTFSHSDLVKEFSRKAKKVLQSP
ncbi:hypothetical protein AMTRI_Chr11g101630 [Amborella trichopoda]